MLDFKNYNDYELIYYIREGSEAALVFMIKKYEPLIKKLATTLIGFSDKKDDLIQEGFLIFMKCVEKYNDNMNCCFYSYFIISLRRCFYKLIKDEYYNMPILEEDPYYIDIESTYKNFKGRDFFFEDDKINMFDLCIIGDTSIRQYATIYNIPYKKALALYEDVKKELKLKYYNISN